MLTAKQKRFCEEYMIDLNATQAALRAGYCKRSVNNIGPANLLKVGIRNEIQKLKDERSVRTQIKADSVLKELAKIGFSDIKNYLNIENDEVYFRNLNEVPGDLTAAVEAVKVMKRTIKGKKKDDNDVEIQAIQFKLHSKLNALEQLGKHLGIYQKDNEQKAQTIFDILAIVGINNNGHERAEIIGEQVG